MKTSLNALCENFIENRDIIKDAFFWESNYIYPVCASVFTDKRQIADADKLKLCKSILNEHTGVFSNFRSTARLVMISMMAVDSDPAMKLQNALRVYGSLKEHFFSSSYLPVASMIISDSIETSRYDEIAERTRHIYDLMKREHPFLTSGEDSVFAAMLALSKLSDEDIVNETEKCYQILHERFFSGNAVQSLSHVLALCEGTAKDKCARTEELFDILKSQGRRYGTSYELATLGVLAMLPDDLTNIANSTLEADEFLSNQRGYGFIGMTARQRLMHASMIVASDYISSTMSGAAISSTLALITAQQAAICAAIAASTAASSASN